MDSVVNHLDLARYVSEIDALARQHGMSLELCKDFREFLDIRNADRERPPVSPIFDPSFTDIGPGNGFWIKGTDEDGEIVHLQAARRNEIRGISLAEHLHELRQLYKLPGLNRDLERASYAAPAAQSISGKICYHGEIWLKGGPDRYRGVGLASLLPRMLLALALAEWDPDYVFGFVPTPIAHKGVLTQYGYMHVQPGGILWSGPDDDTVINKWLAWLSREELIYLMRFSPEAEYSQGRSLPPGKAQAAAHHPQQQA
ncbi:MAG: hypothetical protein OXR84_08260 [Magnetovibrio sp.]|nr:hypothetical protein [Magnetovibrio sp.]